MYRVVAPLVYLRVPDAAGSYVLRTFYRDSLVPEGIHPDSLRHHIETGQVAEQSAPAVVAPEPAETSGEVAEQSSPAKRPRRG